MKVPDGLKYHIIDVWVDELDTVDTEREMADEIERMVGPLRKAESKGWTKTVRARAREALEDTRLKDWRARHEDSGGGSEVGSADHTEEIEMAEEEEEEEWGGIED